MRESIPKTLLIMLGVAFLLRVLLLSLGAFYPGESSLVVGDGSQFLRTANNLLRGHGFSIQPEPPFTPSADFPPLYPLFIAASVKAFDSIVPLLLLQIVLASIMPYLVWKIGKNFSGSKKVAILAAGFMAFEPQTILWSVTLVTETIAVFCLVASSLFFLKYIEDFSSRSNSAWASTFLGISVLTRPHGQFLFPLAVGLVVFLLCVNYFKNFNRQSLQSLFIFIGIFLALLSPWLIRNYNLFGTFSVSATGPRNLLSDFGASILVVKSGYSMHEARAILYEDISQQFGVSRREVTDNPAYGGVLAKEGIKMILQNPKESSQVSFMALGAFFTQDLYTDYLQRFKIVPKFDINFSPSMVLFQEGPLNLALLIWDRLGFYSIIPVVARMFWILINIGWIAGLIIAIKKGGREMMIGLLMAGVILYYAAISLPGALGDQGRYRYQSSAFMFVLANFAFFHIVRPKKLLTKK